MSELVENLRKYNFWSGEPVKTGFRRDRYLTGINQYIGNSLVKVLVGQRRTGKSYLMRQIIGELITGGTNPGNIFYFNKEVIEFDEVDNYQKLHLLIAEYKAIIKPFGKIYLFLDEIQLVDQWEKLVNSYSQDYTAQYEIFITGSNSTLLANELATLLSGRFVTFGIYPFSFGEFCNFRGEVKNRQSLINYLKSGGLPELLHLEEEEMKLHYASSLRDTILLRDIVQRFRIKDAWLLENLFKFIVLNVGNLFSVNSIVNYFNSHKIKTNHETILAYLGHLKQSLLIHEAERFNIKAREILAGTKKFYLNDLAFRNFSPVRFEFGLSQNLENFVYLHYKMLGFKIFVGNLKDKEIDFVIENENEKRYVQVTWTLNDAAVVEREFGNLEQINDHYQKTVISMDDVSFGNRNGVVHQLAWNLANS